MIDNSITDIVIPNYLETIQKAFYEREFVKLDYKTRIISSKKYFKNLLETISVFQQNNVTPEELFSLVCEFTYHDFLQFFKNYAQSSVDWYMIGR